ncbi:MAG: hypothetical protein GY874_06240 [Desulfobacteraceae bacterium]|nr:hypothetical protein [Desulfobacteraceae bacterium]
MIILSPESIEYQNDILHKFKEVADKGPEEEGIEVGAIGKCAEVEKDESSDKIGEEAENQPGEEAAIPA